MSLRMSAAQFQKEFGYPPPDAPPTAKAQIRMPAPVKMNKTETEWMEHAKRRHPGCTVHGQMITLRLPSGTKYTPDVVVMVNGNVIVAMYEVKGPHIHNQRSIHAFKEAKSAYPHWQWIFAQKTKAGWATDPPST
jgi:hypothetical protein